jgi:hypothetical protein
MAYQKIKGMMSDGKTPRFVQVDAEGRIVVSPALVETWAIEVISHPFAKGSLTTDGIQYCTEVTGILHTAYTGVDTQTIYQPDGFTLYEIEFGLTGAVKSSSSAKLVTWKWQASDDGTSWQDLIAATTRAADASAYADVSCSGRFAPTTNFIGKGSSFKVRFAAQAEDAGETVSAKTKNSSYIICRYRRS